MQDFTSLLLFYMPLGVIGLWRWGTWLMRKTISWFYVPIRGEYQATVSVVTPVYMEDPAVLKLALESWKANGPAEIIAVIDAADKASIEEFRRFAAGFPGAKLIITEKPGKRPALADGVKAATCAIVALVDSDTIWGASVLKHALPPFADAKVGGVATRQNVLSPKTLAQNLFDIQLDLRFHDDMMPSAVAGHVFTCLSGRTALYRREAILPLLDDLVHEKFWGKQCIGGDDKRLTYLIEAAGWKARYQHDAQVYTPGASDLSTFFKQRTRWSRNTWRADLRAMWQGWVWKHPFLAFVLIDRTISNFTMLLSLTYFVVSLILGLWIPAAILLGWFLFSRGIRISSHLARRPGNFKLIPVYVVTSYIMATIRIYGLFTLNRQDWITRGAAKRSTFGLFMARVAVVAIITGLGVIVYRTRF